ncbi:MAG TPA: ribonuclease H family protein [Haliscomenobacter sp.]|uniref:ribonuclease H family protein n=1 Tax=Haliscomenobacter sp. TaxID=2717303 RepID=UPI002CBB1692|nr:ribonuclease H family protein [Haliscomenobacter sp.]HOY19814.1 ribonuclease H family protein [Haliscomenobacter sp.]HPH18898.1 ribonuclease H family protein [Haliscomenobacter sp.]
MSKAKKYYVVWTGAKPGIYESWVECQAQINGFPGARYKSYESKAEAEKAFKQTAPSFKPGAAKTSGGQGMIKRIPKAKSAIIKDSISVDAACSGNPGKMEYQGVWTDSKEQIFHQAFPLGTNNIGEFLALVHALALCQKKGWNFPIYSDSVNAMKWIKQKKCKTTLVENQKTEELYEVIDRAEKWLAENTYSNKLIKWETEDWGEIPADFGRK